MEKFIFNNISSEELGIIVKEMPPITKAEKNIEKIEVSGRNGSLHIDEGTYKSKSYSIKCIIKDKSKINEIKQLYEGTGILELSTEPNIEYEATIKNQIDFSKYLTYLKEFTLQFELQPIGYSKVEKESSFTENTVFKVNGTADVYPLITINGVGNIVLNNVAVQVLESGITIDCKLMNCTKNNINKNNKVVLEDFPKIIPNFNNLVLGSGIESVKITYKEGYL